jgi:hypothetical protein
MNVYVFLILLLLFFFCFLFFYCICIYKGETLVRIEADVEAAAHEVEVGQSHIADTYNITKGNRGTILKVFATVLFLAVILVVT